MSYQRANWRQQFDCFVECTGRGLRLKSAFCLLVSGSVVSSESASSCHVTKGKPLGKTCAVRLHK